jgi:hypothetical protein
MRSSTPTTIRAILHSGSKKADQTHQRRDIPRLVKTICAKSGSIPRGRHLFGRNLWAGNRGRADVLGDCIVPQWEARLTLMIMSRRRLIAGFIVLWAMMDLTVPGVCQSDDFEASLAAGQHIGQTITSDMGANVGSSTAPTNSQSDQSGPEDCFCCCSHVAPTGFFHASILFSFVGNEPPYRVGAPHGFSPFLYHPPKA